MIDRSVLTKEITQDSFDFFNDYKDTLIWLLRMKVSKEHDIPGERITQAIFDLQKQHFEFKKREVSRPRNFRTFNPKSSTFAP